jgi:hypothetical protein
MADISTLKTTMSDNASSLKYEKTQNRDVIGTIERINRSQQFKPAAEMALDRLGEAASDFAVKEFRQQWRNVHESHENPTGYNIEVSIGSPIYKKTGGSDSPFHYVMSISTIFTMECPPNGDGTEAEAKERMANWFHEKISQTLNRKVVERMNALMSESDELKGLFSFNLLQKPEEGEEEKIGGRKPVERSVNVSYMTTLSPKQKEMSNSDTLPFKDSEMVRYGLISNIAMAIERIRNFQSPHSVVEGA